MLTCRYLAIALTALVVSSASAQTPGKAKKPNVIIVITDDQGYGDLGFHGNPVIKTPHIDKFAKQSVRMKNFYVSPVCSPTRSSLMTGRYNYRTGVVDTFQGRSMMYPDELTLARILRMLGYRTGIFGKWHLGDNYPLRAMDHGFEETLVLKGGGIGQASDPPGGESYFNPILQKNGKAVRKEGYCTDIFTDAAIDFVTKNKAEPFFCYVALNCPHTPLELPEKYYQPYKGKIKLSQFPTFGFPVGDNVNLDETAKVYGMITNIDDNVGRLLAKLEELGIADDTIVIFMTDNGPQQPRYNSGFRGRKGTVFEGGTHVPFFVRWPASLPGDRDIHQIAAHIDVAPTIVAACGGDMPRDRKIDGKNLLGLWRNTSADWNDRDLFFQWHRGDIPEMYRAFAVRTQRWRLVQPVGVPENSKFDKTRLLLFDIQNDPYEINDVASKNPETVAQLKTRYEVWFKDMESTRKFAPPRIVVGSDKENPTLLSRQDMRIKPGGKPAGAGYWELEVERAGQFEFTLTLPKMPGKSPVAHVTVGDHKLMKMTTGADETTLVGAIELPAGPARLEAWLSEADNIRGPRFIEIRRK